jgi:tetratricopeptide (TPR) repeat protein
LDKLEIYSGSERSWTALCVAQVAHQIRQGVPQAMELHRRSWGNDGHRYPKMQPWQRDPITVLAVERELVRCGYPGCPDCKDLSGVTDPSIADVAMAEAERLLDAEEHSQTLRLLRDLSGEYRKPPAWWSPPQCARYFLVLGDTLHASGDSAAAVQCYETLISLEESLETSRAGQANTWGRMTVSRAAVGDVAGAAEAFQACTVLADGMPHHAWSYHYGCTLLQQEDWTNARRALNLASEQADPDHARINDALLWGLSQEMIGLVVSGAGAPPELHALFEQTISRLRAAYIEHSNQAGLDIVVRGEVLYLAVCGREEDALVRLREHSADRTPDNVLAHVWWALAETLRQLGQAEASQAAYAVVAQWGADGNARLARDATTYLSLEE